MIELDMPNRTTRDYEGPAVAPKVQAALDAALQDEEDLTLDAEWVFTQYDLMCCTIFRPRSHSLNMLKYTRFSKNENQLGKHQARLPLVQASSSLFPCQRHT